jgi:hypothetical protein
MNMALGKKVLIGERLIESSLRGHWQVLVCISHLLKGQRLPEHPLFGLQTCQLELLLLSHISRVSAVPQHVVLYWWNL